MTSVYLRTNRAYGYANSLTIMHHFFLQQRLEFFCSTSRTSCTYKFQICILLSLSLSHFPLQVPLQKTTSRSNTFTDAFSVFKIIPSEFFWQKKKKKRRGAKSKTRFNEVRCNDGVYLISVIVLFFFNLSFPFSQNKMILWVLIFQRIKDG